MIEARKKRRFSIPYFKMNQENSIYVANINFTTSEMTLGQHFESYGDIVHVKIIEDYLGNSKGFGFVEFETKGIHLILE